MIHLKTTCDMRRQKKDGSHPIIYRISLYGKSRDLSSGLSCLPKEWDSKKGNVKSKNAELQTVAKRIQDERMRLLEKLRQFEHTYPDCVNVQDVKNYLSDKKEQPSTVHEFWVDEIKRLESSAKYGNARNYQCALNGLSKVSTLRVSFEKINYKWLVDTETKLRENDLKTNSISIYMRKLRSIFNRAINYEVVEQNFYPFRRYKIRSEATSPRVISVDELTRYFKKVSCKEKRKVDAWNMGRLIFLLRGINFADLAVLTRENIKNNRIVYKRTKTQKIYSVEILPLTLEILKYYEDPSRHTLLPILSNKEYENVKIRFERIRQQRKTCNKWLKRVGDELGIVEPLSSYVFRFSHANACKTIGFSKDLISESLGHGYGLAVSSAYLENYDIELIDEMNRVVCKKVIGGG